MKAITKSIVGPRSAADDEAAIMRLEFEMALAVVNGAKLPWTDVVRQAAEASGGDFLFVLPVPAANRTLTDCAFLRLRRGELSRILHVSQSDGWLAVQDEAGIDSDLLDFARASLDVLERLQADDRVISATA